eukprot:805793_1
MRCSMTTRFNPEDMYGLYLLDVRTVPPALYTYIGLYLLDVRTVPPALYTYIGLYLLDVRTVPPALFTYIGSYNASHSVQSESVDHFAISNALYTFTHNLFR